MSGFTFRKAEQTDISDIAEAKKRALLEEWNWNEEMLCKITESFVEAIQRDELTVYLAFCGDEFAGMGVMLTLREDVTLCDFYVFPKYRRQGIMHGLMNSLIQEARERGCECALIVIKEEYRGHWQDFGFRDLYEENDDGETVLSTRMEMLLN